MKLDHGKDDPLWEVVLGVAGLGLPKSNAFLTVVPEESVFFEHILDIDIFFF